MKNLIILAHSTYEKSFANKGIIDGLKDITAEKLKIRNLYTEYGHNFFIDLEKEKKDLLAHDRIILQFPVEWYNIPSLLKRWVDIALAFDFAYSYNREDDSKFQLKGKKLLLSFTTGGPAEAYQPTGINKHTALELMSFLELTANFCKMEFETPIISYGINPMNKTREESIQKHIKDLTTIITK